MEVNFWLFITLGWFIVPLAFLCVVSCYSLAVVVNVLAAPFKALKDTDKAIEGLIKNLEAGKDS